MKLLMFGTSADGPTSVRCDNEAVCKSASTPESILSKKMYGMPFNFCREVVAADIVIISKEDTLTNLTCAFATVLDKIKRDDILKKFMC